MLEAIDQIIDAAVRSAIEAAPHIDYMQGHLLRPPQIGVGSWQLRYDDVIRLYGYDGPLLTAFGIAELTKKSVLVVNIDSRTYERKVTHTVTPGHDGEIAEYIPATR